MKKDIKIPEVKNVALAIAKEISELGATEYNVYLINRRNHPMEQVLILSKGYHRDAETDEIIKTSSLRHHIENLPTDSYAKIEAIMPELFSFTNEYTVSFWDGNQLYDKKFIFLPDVVKDENMVEVQELNLQGVVIE